VGEQQNRLAAAPVAPVTHHQRRSLADRQDVDVFLGESRSPEALGQILRHRGHLAESLGRAERDDLLEDLARFLADFLGGRVFGGRAGGAEQSSGGENDADFFHGRQAYRPAAQRARIS